MRKFRLISLLLFIVFCSSCNQKPSQEEAIDFNDKIVEDQLAYLEKENAFINAMEYNYNDYSTDDTIPDAAKEEAVSSLQETYENLKKFTEEKLKEYKESEAFDKEDVFRQAFIDYLSSYKKLIDNQYFELMEIQSFFLQNFEVTEKMIVDWDTLKEEVEQSAEKIEKDFEEAQLQFASQYEFELLEDDEGEKE
jgi:hypothetical protein